MTYHLEHAPGRTALINGQEYLFFSGYSYLGVGHVPEFLKLVKTGMNKYGLLHPSSRISNTQNDLYKQFEEKLSVITNTEETVSFSSGYLAGRAVADLLATNTLTCFVAPDTHPALQKKAIALNRHWKKTVVQNINESKEKHFTLLTDSVNPLKACVHDFNFLSGLNADKRLTCIIDDSHGFGCLGPNGEGISYYLPKLQNVEFVLTYSLSKAMHMNGGAVSCSHTLARQIRLSPYYTASTPIAPASIYAFLEGRDIYLDQQKKLLKNISLFIALLKDVPGIINHPSLPVFLLKEEYDQSVFHPHQLIISSFSYPDPTGKRINRIVLNALHTLEDLQRVAWLLQEMAW